MKRLARFVNPFFFPLNSALGALFCKGANYNK